VDDSGQFNYHLDRLVGTYVRRVDEDGRTDGRSDSGYELRNAGRRVVRAVLAGTFTSDLSLEPMEVDATCPKCDSTVAVSSEDGHLYARCTNCEGSFGFDGMPEGTIMSFDLPPAGFRGRTPDELLRAGLRWEVDRARSVMAGVCPECSGRQTVSVRICEDHDHESGTVCDQCGSTAWGLATYVCETCKAHLRITTWTHVLTHPTVIAFYHDHGIEFSFASWEDHLHGETYSEERVSEDPLRIRVTITVGGDELRVTLDGGLNVVGVEEAR
jgi:hypothetical protein